MRNYLEMFSNPARVFWKSFVLVSCLLVLGASGALAQSGGQTIYNGIVLPSQWPPVGTPTQAYQLPFYITSPPSVITIDVGRQLFVDDFLIQSTTLTRTQHQPVMYPGNPIIIPNSLDTLGLAMPYSDGVWYDPAAQLYKMWFYCGPPIPSGQLNAGLGFTVCYAYSTDGKNWIRPSLPNAVVPNTDEVLQIPNGRDSVTIWMDLQDPNPAQKFKAFAYQPESTYGVLVFFSADGITWVPQNQTSYPIDAIEDRTTFFWNPFRNVWVDSLKNYVNDPASGSRPAYTTRLRYYAESPDLFHWTPSDFTDSFWTGPDVNDPPYPLSQTLPQLYNLDGVAYESLMVGLFSWYYPGPQNTTDDPTGLAGPDIVELGVGFSRDGFHWVRPTRGGGPSNAFIPASNIAGTWNMGNTQSAGGGFLVVGDELWFYFSGRNEIHSGNNAVGSTGLATLRRDGFYSMDAGATPGVLTTRPVQFSGKYMFVNVNDPQGSLQIQVLNPTTNQVLATSLPLSVNKTLQAVTWSGGGTDLSAFVTPGQQVEFQFTMTNGSLYSFWVTSSAAGASNGYVAANGPGFTGSTDTLGSAAYPTVAATPEISPAGGNFASSATVSIFSGTPGATITYTLDGTTPTATSATYTGPFQLTGSATVKAVAFATGLGNSAVAAATFNQSTIAPSVSITAPLNGHTVSGLISVTASASDSVGIASVQFTADGLPIGTVTTLPYTVSLETTTLSNGNHQISAVAVDSVGNQATAATVTVNVNNVTSGPTTGLVGYWSFDSAYVVQPSLLDQSGNNNNATGYSTPSVVGEIGQALQFNGISSYTQVVSNTQVYDLMGDLTLSLWVQTTNSTRTEALLSRYAAGGSGYGYVLRTNPAGTAEVLVGGANLASGVSAVFTDTKKINDGKWHEITVVFKLASGITFYVDGTQTSTFAMSGVAMTAASYFQMGLNPWTPYGTYFTGTMDEVRIYNRALSAADVSALTQPYAPIVSLTAPTNNQIVSGSTSLTATATDQAGIAKVQFQVDGAAFGSVTTAPYTLNLDTTTLTNNTTHQITAVATDTEGNQASSTTVTITVNNTAWYVSPTGSPSGSGTLASPWDLQTALNQPSVVQPGSTIWLLGGVYYGNYNSALNGTAANPITVRNYQGQRVSLDGQGGAYNVLTINGSYTWFWGLEVVDTTDIRVSTNTLPTNAAGVVVYGVGISCIDMVVHDTAESFAAFNAASNGVFYGNLAYYNGYVGTDRNHGHGMYMQNNVGSKTIANNFVGDNGDEGMQIYGSNTAQIIGFNITGNTLYNTGSWPNPNYHFNLLLGGGATRQNIQVQNNYSYLTPSANAGGNSLGQYTIGQNVTATNNVFAGGNIALYADGESGPVVFSGNIVYAIPSAAQLVQLGLFTGQTLSSYTWNNNTYYGLNGFYLGTYDGNNFGPTTNGTFQNWQLQTGLDSTSTYTPNAPTGTWTYIQPNQYEQKRANITIYNWNLSASVAVDLSSVLSVNDQYVILDAQNFYGPAVASGTYEGGTVSIPMTGLTKAAAIGFTAPAHTAPQFGTFVVMLASSVPAVSVSPLTSTLYSGQTQSFSAIVRGLAGQAVSWSISPAVGSISASGVYSAPATILQSQTITVTAVNQSNLSTSATAIVFLVPSISVSVAPPTATLGQNQTQQFNATVVNSVNTAVTWSLSPNVGTVTTAGLYTAPASIAAAQTITLTATTVATPTATATAAINLTPPPAVFVTPSSVALNQGQTQQFAASVQGSSNQAVTWSLSPNVGTISSSGLYTAPSTVTVGQVLTLTATSVALPALTATATINLTLTPLTPPSGLALYWSFDTTDLSNGQVLDLSGNNGTGTLNGTLLPVTGKLNQALNFNGVNSYIATGINTATAFNNNLTLSAWINTTNSSRLEAIISKYSAAGSGWGYIFRTDQSGHLELSIGASDVTVYPATAIDTATINDGNWHHVAAVITIGQNVTFYVDGNQTSSTAISSVANGDSNSVFMVGANSYAPYGNFFTGTIDEVRVYNVALTAAQVSVVYQLSGGGPPPIVVSVTPANVTLTQTQTQPFTATLQNTTNQSVTWQASPVGTIASTGANTATYTPPASILATQTVTVTATSSADGKTTGTATVNLIPTNGATTASFTGTDTTTQGGWEGVYGNDGYSIASSSQSLPSYATVAVQNAANYIWVPNSADPRALQTGVGTARIAACWYAGTSFDFDVNITDGNTHQVALYALDWDNYGGGRAEQIQIVNATTNAVLDTRNVAAFTNGTYLIWNISGHVHINVTLTGGGNIVMSGVFFGGGHSSLSTPTIAWTTPAAITYGTALTATQLNATATFNGTAVPGTFVYTPAAGVIPGAGNQTLSVTFTPTNTTTYASATGTVVLPVNQATPVITWATPAAISYGTALSGSQLNAAANFNGSSLAGTFAYTPAAGAILGAGSQTLSVTFTPSDTTDYKSASATASLLVNQATPTITWSTPAAITYGTALSGSQLNAAANFNGSSLAGTFAYTPAAGAILGAGSQTLSVTFTPSDTTDYKSASATASLLVNQATPTITWATPAPVTSGTALSATQLNATAALNGSAVAGTFLYSPAAGTIPGVGSDTLSVTFTPSDTTDLKPASASVTLVVNQAVSSGNQAAFATLDTATQGNWQGVYGPDGYSIANDSQSLPSYATFSVSNQSNYTWSSNTTDPRSLERGGGSGRIAACWYSASTFVFDINITDGSTRQVAVYALDWDSYLGGRSETVQILDGSTGTVLDSRTISGFSNGVYLVWKLSGHVKINVIFLSGGNSVVSGVFFGGGQTVQNTPTISWSNPAAITYGTALSATQLNATASFNGSALPGTFAYAPAAGAVLGAGSQALSVTFTPTDTTDYKSATATATQVVNQATPVIVWSTPAAITYGTALSATQLNATVNFNGAAVAGSLVYTPAAGSVPGVGNPTLSVTFTPTDTVDYKTVSATVVQAVNQATPVIAWSTPAAITYGTSLSSAQLNATVSANGSSVAGNLVYTPALGTVLGAGNQTLSVTFTPSDTVDYKTVSATVVQAVNQATPTITWATPSPISSGTPLSATQLNAAASFNGSSVPGTFVYTPASGAVLGAGNQTLSVTFTPTDNTDFKPASASVTLVVTTQSVPVITWPTPAAITYGTAIGSIQLNASAAFNGSAVSGTFAYTPASGTVLGAGSQTLSVTFTPSNTSQYTSATATVTLLVNQATPVITWATPAAITYGTALSATQLNATANFNGTVAGSLVYTPALGAILGAGTQTLSVAFTPTDTTDYKSASGTVSLVVGQATPLVTWATPAAITYGTALSRYAAQRHGYPERNGGWQLPLHSCNRHHTWRGQPYPVGDVHTDRYDRLSLRKFNSFAAGEPGASGNHVGHAGAYHQRHGAECDTAQCHRQLQRVGGSRKLRLHTRIRNSSGGRESDSVGSLHSHRQHGLQVRERDGHACGEPERSVSQPGFFYRHRYRDPGELAWRIWGGRILRCQRFAKPSVLCHVRCAEPVKLHMDLSDSGSPSVADGQRFRANSSLLVHRHDLQL